MAKKKAAKKKSTFKANRQRHPVTKSKVGGAKATVRKVKAGKKSSSRSH